MASDGKCSSPTKTLPKAQSKHYQRTVSQQCDKEKMKDGKVQSGQ